jgi:Arc/MetJ family transcription regulator
LRRTNIVLDETVVNQAKVMTGIRTTRGVVDLALHELVRVRKQRGIRALRGRIRWTGGLAAMRRGRAGG